MHPNYEHIRKIITRARKNSSFTIFLSSEKNIYFNISPNQSTSEFPKSVCTSVFYILTTKSSNFDIVPRQIVMYCMYYTGIIHVLYNTSTFFEKILKVWEERKNESKLHETASVECFQITGNRCCKMNPNYRTL